MTQVLTCDVASNLFSGILLIHKPVGCTSFDCIRTLKKSLNRKDIGHGGTLDSFAEGLLPVMLGEGLKFSRFFLEEFPTLPFYWKRYEGTVRFDFSTTTADPTGDVLDHSDPKKLLELKNAILNRAPELYAEIETMVAESFVAKRYVQTPPAYSAKKIGGVRFSDLARSAEALESVGQNSTSASFAREALEKHVADRAREVILKSFKIKAVELLDDAVPVLRFEILCSKGFYVRSFAQDLAALLGLKAHLMRLVRTGVGNFNLSNAVPLSSDFIANAEAGFFSVGAILDAFPQVVLDENLSSLMKRSSWATAQTGISELTPRTPGVYALLSTDLTPLALVERNQALELRHLRGLTG